MMACPFCGIFRQVSAVSAEYLVWIKKFDTSLIEFGFGEMYDRRKIIEAPKTGRKIYKL